MGAALVKISPTPRSTFGATWSAEFVAEGSLSRPGDGGVVGEVGLARGTGV
jgi:hypothetical protein